MAGPSAGIEPGSGLATDIYRQVFRHRVPGYGPEFSKHRFPVFDPDLRRSHVVYGVLASPVGDPERGTLSFGIVLDHSRACHLVILGTQTNSKSSSSMFLIVCIKWLWRFATDVKKLVQQIVRQIEVFLMTLCRTLLKTE